MTRPDTVRNRRNSRQGFGASRLAMTVYDLPPGHGDLLLLLPLGWGRHDEALDHVIRRSPDLDYWDGERS